VKAQTVKALDHFVLSASNETLTIDSVLFNGSPLPFVHENDHLIAAMPTTVDPPTLIEVEVFYHGLSKFHGQYESGGVCFNMVKGLGRIATSSEPTFSRTWWPCKDVPDDKATEGWLAPSARVALPYRNLLFLGQGFLCV
jgi:aminopeptidase N